MVTSASVNAKISVFIRDTELAHAIIHGTVDTVVQTDGGEVDSFARVMRRLEESFNSGVGGIFDTVVGGYAIRAEQARDEAVTAANSIGDAVQDAQGFATDAQNAATETAEDRTATGLDRAAVQLLAGQVATDADAATTAASEAATSRTDAQAAAQSAATDANTASEAATTATTAATAAEKTVPEHSETPPEEPIPGARWTRTQTMKTYEWSGEPGNYQWVEVGSQVVVGYATAEGATGAAQQAVEAAAEADASRDQAVAAADQALNLAGLSTSGTLADALAFAAVPALTSNAASEVNAALNAQAKALADRTAFLRLRSDAVETYMASRAMAVRDFMTAEERADVAGGGMTINLLPRLQAVADLAAAAGVPLFINAGTYGIDFNGSDGLVPASGAEIIFHANAKLKARPTNKNFYRLIKIEDKTNVTLRSPWCDGNNAQNTATTGEFGMGISILGGSNITIYDPKTVNCWGDGMYISTGPSTGDPKNVVVHRHVADACRRQGVSIIHADGVHFYDPVWKNIAGAPAGPWAGLDIEPNDNTGDLKDVIIMNPRTENCAGAGVMAYLNAMYGATARTVDVKIINHVDMGSTVAASFQSSKSAAKASSADLRGLIQYTAPSANGNKLSGIQLRCWGLSAPRLDITRPKLTDWNRNASASATYGSAITCYVEAADDMAEDVGNFTVSGAEYEFASGTPHGLLFLSAPASGRAMSGVSFIDPASIRGVPLANRRVLANAAAALTFSDAAKLTTLSVAGSFTVDTNYRQSFTLAAGAAYTATLANTLPAGAPDVVINIGGGAFQNVFASAVGLLVGYPANQRGFSSNVAGSYMRLRSVGAGKFLVVEKVGTWNDVVV